MTHLENHAPISNQASIQNIHGNVIFNEAGVSQKRFRQDLLESDPEKLLDDDILASLAFPQMFDRRSNVESAHDQTCQWLFGVDEYCAWKSQPRGLLWIKGKPGSGKSTLMSHLHRDLWLGRDVDRDVNLEFFFSARGTLLQRTPIGMIRSLLNQIYCQSNGTREFLRHTYLEKRQSFGSSGSSWEWQLAELERVFMDTILACAQHRRITLLIDALDEAGDEAARAVANYLHSLNDRIVQGEGTAKICISSRHYPIVSDTEAVEVHMERHNQDDIGLYIKDHIKTSKLTTDETQQDLSEITQTIVDMAQGVFQWVCLIVPMIKKWLSEGDSTEQILINLSTVPKDLEAVYEHILRNVIDSRHSKKTLRLFQWVCLAQRPLSVMELRYALSAERIETGHKHLRCHEACGFEKSSQVMCRRITTWSGGLLEAVSSERGFSPWLRQASGTRHDKQVVQVIHQSVTDFMLRRGLSLLTVLNNGEPHTTDKSLPLLDSEEILRLSHKIIYLSCLKYMCTEFAGKALPKEMMSYFEYMERQAEAKSQFPFLEYSAQYGLDHANKSDDYRLIDLEDEMRLLRGSCNMWVFACMVLHEYRSSYSDSLAWPRVKLNVTTLHLAAIGNLRSILVHGINCNADVNATDITGWTALHTAAGEGHLAIVKLLYEGGADIQSGNRLGDTPLLLAASRGHIDVFAYLLNHDAKLDATNHRSEGVLYAAARRGDIAMCRVCLDAGADVNIQGGEYGTALQAAAAEVRKDVVRALLRAGANVNAQGGHFGNALQAAARRGSKDTVRVLLEAGADVNAQGGEYEIALQAAVWSNNEDVIAVLLDFGADVNAKGGYYGNTLQAAAISGGVDIIRLLLNAGADVNAQGGEYGNALQAAAMGNSKEVISLLLDSGADIHARGGHYGSVLQAAAISNNEEVIRLLLKADADVNTQGGHYGNALQAAAISNNRKVVSLLLNAGADVNARGGYWGTALQAAASKGNVKSVCLLINAGADVNAQGGEEGTALKAALDCGDGPTVCVLVAAGADDIPDSPQGLEYSIPTLKLSEVDGDEMDLDMTLLNDDTASDHASEYSRTVADGYEPHDEEDVEYIAGGQWLLSMLGRLIPWS